MKPSQKKTINGNTFTVNHLDPWSTLDVTPLVADVFGGLIGTMFSAAGADEDEEKMADAITGFIQAVGKVDRKKLRELTEILTSVSVVDGDKGGPLKARFDEVFQGDPESMFRWLAFAAEVNFMEFFRKAFQAERGKKAKQ